MKLIHSRSRSLITLGLLCSSSIVSAFPLIRLPAAVSVPAEVKGEMKRSPQPSYSVVAVDGGSTSSSGPAPTRTVTKAITEVQTSLMFSTVVVATPSTSDALGVATTQTPTTVQTSATPSPMTGAVQPSVTSVPYDDGQWHTTYYFQSTVTPPVAQNQAVTSSSAPAPTSTDDLGE